MKLKQTFSSALALVVVVSGLAGCSSNPEPNATTAGSEAQRGSAEPVYADATVLREAVEAVAGATFSDCYDKPQTRTKDVEASGVPVSVTYTYLECKSLTAVAQGSLFGEASFLVVEASAHGPAMETVKLGPLDHVLGKRGLRDASAALIGDTWSVIVTYAYRNEDESIINTPALEFVQIVADELGGTIVDPKSA